VSSEDVRVKKKVASRLQVAEVPPPKPFGQLPSRRQLLWHELEFYGFIHFTVNTFTDKEWGFGDEAPDVFNPTAFDADQIAEAARASGMKGLILTCKHHDGFCLWPSKHTEHSVRNSRWKRGRGDVVRELSGACERAGIKFGTYLSPWDRNHPAYGRPEYIVYYRDQLHELLTQSGDIFEVWFDGANGGDGFYGGARETRTIDKFTYYEWERTRAMVRELQPEAVMFSDAGPDVRWVGNEQGFAGNPCWATINAQKYVPGDADAGHLGRGDFNGAMWLPAECDVSIRPGWFYHATEDGDVRSPENLLDLYFRSVGHGGSLLLNFPPDRRGRVHENDVAAAVTFRRTLDKVFARDVARGATAKARDVRGKSVRFAAANVADGRRDTYWSTDDGVTTPDLTIEFPEVETFRVISLREYLPLGQRIERYAVDAWLKGAWAPLATGSAIGSRKLLRCGPVTTKKIRVRITKAPVCPALSEVAVYAG